MQNLFFLRHSKWGFPPEKKNAQAYTGCHKGLEAYTVWVRRIHKLTLSGLEDYTSLHCLD